MEFLRTRSFQQLLTFLFSDDELFDPLQTSQRAMDLSKVLQTPQTSQPTSRTARAPKRKRQKPEKAEEKRKKPKVEDVPGLLAQWPSPKKVIFQPMVMKGRLSPQPLLPPGAGIEPYELFSLFIPEDLYATISRHTNLYADLHAGHSRPWKPGCSRPWKPTTPGDIKIFFAAIFYMAAWGSLPIDAYWRSGEVVFTRLQESISQTRFEQIQRFLHISDPRTNAFEPASPEDEELYDVATLDSLWWYKVEPLVGRFRQACTQYYQPSDSVAIDESVIRCFGRSFHTYKLPNKPIPQGYKLYALADRGYIWYWFFASRAKSTVEVIKEENLTMTGSMVLELLQKLPPEPGRYTVYLDNYFTSINLFKRLRQEGIGACGTTRPSASPQFHPTLAVLKESKLTNEWNSLYADVQDDVLCIAWQDNNTVTALSTVHTVHKDDDWVKRKRKCPSKTSTNATTARKPFNGRPTADLPIPRLIDDYNHYMGGVDIANQLRAVYETHRKAWRSWWPLFYWCLDTAAVNAYKISHLLRAKRQLPQLTHADFREALYIALFTQGRCEQERERKQEQEQEQEQKREREQAPQPQPGQHELLRHKTRQSCQWCLYKTKKHSLKPQVKQTYFTCQSCLIRLCKPGAGDCWKAFHSPRTPLGERDVNSLV